VKREGDMVVYLCIADTVWFWDIKKNIKPSKTSRLSGVFELVHTMLEIGCAENRSFQPIAPPVWIKEFPPLSRSLPDYGCDFGVWAGTGADFGDDQSQSITGADARSGPS
jgi:hypothetical protein